MVKVLPRRLIAALFEMLYGPLAPAYDLVSQMAFAGEWERWRRLAAAQAQQLPIVELGCGTGWLVADLTQQQHLAIGIDLSPAMLTQARKRANGRLLRARAQRLPLRDRSVGTLLAIFPTAYILTPATWREAERVLTPGGRLVIALSGWLEGHGMHRQLLRGSHRLIYRGDAGRLTLPETSLTGEQVVLPSTHGRLVLYIGTQPTPAAPPG
jgi:SAM-dependent methyltransferase